jgi:hypothetical protein
MSSDPQTATTSKAMLRTGRVLGGLPALFLLLDGVMKLVKPLVRVLRFRPSSGADCRLAREPLDELTMLRILLDELVPARQREVVEVKSGRHRTADERIRTWVSQESPEQETGRDHGLRPFAGVEVPAEPNRRVVPGRRDQIDRHGRTVVVMPHLILLNAVQG